MKNKFAFAVPALAALMIAPPVLGTTLFHDDGSSESAFGNSGASNVIWMVRYTTPTPGVTQVYGVSAAFGTPSSPGNSGGNGQALTYGVWSDPNGDGNPLDGVLLASGAGATNFVDTDIFVLFTLGSPVTITTSQFFVGYLLPVGNTFPVAFDTNNSLTATSYGFLGTDMTTLSNNTGPIDLNGIEAGVAMIRAHTIPEPSVLAGLAVGSLVLFGRSRRRR